MAVPLVIPDGNERRPNENVRATSTTGQVDNCDPTADLATEAVALAILKASVHDATNIGTYAVEAALRNWAVGPLRGKAPTTGLTPNGVLDFNSDIGTVIRWWGSGQWNLGARVPPSMVVIDVDPRGGGDVSLAALAAQYGPLPETLTTISGRLDGGRHYFYRRPPGKLSARRLGPGIDLKTSAGYVVLPPSIHPDTGYRYVRVDRPVAAPPRWLCELLTTPTTPQTTRPTSSPWSPPTFWSPVSIADNYSTSASWADVLGPHGWRCLDADPDADGARWLHPAATSACSATVRHGCLFVYSTSTAFDPTEPGNPTGYTRFAAYSMLNHGGDRSAAARALRGVTP